MSRWSNWSMALLVAATTVPPRAWAIGEGPLVAASISRQVRSENETIEYEGEARSITVAEFEAALIRWFNGGPEPVDLTMILAGVAASGQFQAMPTSPSLLSDLADHFGISDAVTEWNSDKIREATTLFRLAAECEARGQIEAAAIVQREFTIKMLRLTRGHAKLEDFEALTDRILPALIAQARAVGDAHPQRFFARSIAAFERIGSPQDLRALSREYERHTFERRLLLRILLPGFGFATTILPTAFVYNQVIAPLGLDPETSVQLALAIPGVTMAGLFWLAGRFGRFARVPFERVHDWSDALLACAERLGPPR